MNRMSASVPIGEFSRLTHLTVKSLRHYHDLGLLEPAQIDASTGYRRYAVDQVPTALLIGRLRGLEMPLADVRTVLDASDTDRNTVIGAHLERMEAELDRTRTIVASLRTLLTSPLAASPVSYRTIPDQHVLSIRDVAERDAIGAWCEDAYGRLYAQLEATGVSPDGDAGATYSDPFFTYDRGDVEAFVPVAAGTPGARILVGGHFAIALHVGPFTELDRAYAALGTHVAEHSTVAPGPIREIYLDPTDDDPDTPRTEVCWPIAP